MVGIFAKHISNKGQVSKIYEELSKLNKKKTTLFLKMSNRCEQALYQRRGMNGRYMKTCSPSLVTRKMQIEMWVRYHYIPIRMAETKNIKCWRRC